MDGNIMNKQNMENKIQVIQDLLKNEQNQNIKKLIEIILKEQLNKSKDIG